MSEENKQDKVSANQLRKMLSRKTPTPSTTNLTQSQIISEEDSRSKSTDAAPKRKINIGKLDPSKYREHSGSHVESSYEIAPEISEAPKQEKNLLKSDSTRDSNKRTGTKQTKVIDSSQVNIVFGSDQSRKMDRESEKRRDDHNLFDIDIKKNEVYSKKNFILPVDIQMREEKKQGNEIQIENEPKDSATTILTDLNKQFCFFQLPTNLPLEGMHKESTKRDDPDFQFDNDDIFKILTEKRFDSTGFFLERDFKTPFVKENIVKEDKLKANDKDINFDVYKLGKLCRMKDGKLKMKIGENYFEVLTGMEDYFYKEIMAVNAQKKMAHSLFPLEKKIIIKPDMNSL